VFFGLRMFLWIKFIHDIGFLGHRLSFDGCGRILQSTGLAAIKNSGSKGDTEYARLREGPFHGHRL